MGKFFNDSPFKNDIPETKDAKKPQESISIERPRNLSADEYVDRIDGLLERKEYHHWNSKEDQEINRSRIRDYDQKKRAVDKASLQTQRSILTKYRNCFDSENINRMHSELGSNKIEIYNEPYFVSEKAPDVGGYRVVGMRDFPDGKICVRDTDDLNRLKHTSTHETMHDLSFQNATHLSDSKVLDNGKIATYSRTELTSGIHKVDKAEKIVDGKVETTDIRHSNRFLNEGLTELYTIEEMNARGEFPHFDSYSQEVGWALNLRESVGDEVVAQAYFGGDVESLRDKVNGMSNIPDAWDVLNQNIDAYHHTGNLKYKFAADSIIDELHGGRVLVKRRA